MSQVKSLFEYLDLSNNSNPYIKAAKAMGQDYEEFKKDAESCHPFAGKDVLYHDHLYEIVAERYLEDLEEGNNGLEFTSLNDIIGYVDDYLFNTLEQGEENAIESGLGDVYEEYKKW